MNRASRFVPSVFHGLVAWHQSHFLAGGHTAHDGRLAALESQLRHRVIERSGGGVVLFAGRVLVQAQ